jgi:hypothetical protein
MIEIWVGTRKGAFVFRSKDREQWTSEGPLLVGEEVNHVVQDPRRPNRYYAAAGSAWFGPHLRVSEDAGKTWQPSEEGLSLESMEKSVKRIWHIRPGADDELGVLYAGVDPGALFKSEDDGKTWRVVDGLTKHSTRDQWQEGAGGMMVHSIECLGGGRIVVGISAAGAFRTSDGGATWEPYNGGVLADFQPDNYPAVGQCVHKLKAHPRNPEQLFQQNHCGVYTAGFDADRWNDISDGLPSRFGFCLAVPAAEEQTLFTVPVGSPEQRYVPEGKLRVARSRDGGASWQLLDNGLPQENAYTLPLREAMCSDDRDPAGIYFGTTSGAVYYTRDGGESWQSLAQHLPSVFSVTCAYQ